MEPLRRSNSHPIHLGIPPVNPKNGQLSIQKNDNIYSDAPRAGFGIRALAFIIDAFGVFVFSKIFIQVSYATKIFEDQELTVVSYIIDFISIIFIIVLPTALYGKSLGKKILKLKVVRLHEAHQLGFFRGFFRELIGKSVSSWFFFIGYLLALSSKKLTLHDRLFNTKVIRL